MDENNTKIENDTFIALCPVLLYNLVRNNCNDTEPPQSFSDSSEITVWFYSTLAVIVISGCGILGLAVIPIMQKKFYQPLLQFLVALAVGALAGDALLHLLPHAMTNSDHNDHHMDASHHSHNHDDNIWKGFVAMLGLIFFFLMERIITVGAKWRKRKQMKEKVSYQLFIL